MVEDHHHLLRLIVIHLRRPREEGGEDRLLNLEEHSLNFENHRLLHNKRSPRRRGNGRLPNLARLSRNRQRGPGKRPVRKLGRRKKSGKRRKPNKNVERMLQNDWQN
jgi:hypothetical protein